MNESKNPSSADDGSSSEAKDNIPGELWAKYQGRKMQTSRLKGVIYGFFGLIVLMLLFVGLWIVAVR